MRRRAMMVAAEAGDKPLYSFVNLRLYGSGYMSTFTITNGNRFYWSGTRSNTPSYFQFNNGKNNSNQYSSTDSPIFSLHTGDTVYFKATSISYKTANVAGTMQVALVKPDNTIMASLKFAPSPVSTSDFVDFPDFTSTPVIISEDSDILCFKAGRTTGGSFNLQLDVYFNFEMYVNDVRWI